MDKKPKSGFDPKAFLSKIGKGRSIGKYHASQTVFSQGDQADSVLYIEDGKLKLTVVSEQGKEAVVAILGKGEFCGEGCLAGQQKRIAHATAMMECEIMHIEKGAILRVLHDESTFSELFIDHFGFIWHGAQPLPIAFPGISAVLLLGTKSQETSYLCCSITNDPFQRRGRPGQQRRSTSLKDVSYCLCLEVSGMPIR